MFVLVLDDEGSVGILKVETKGKAMFSLPSLFSCLCGWVVDTKKEKDAGYFLVPVALKYYEVERLSPCSELRESSGYGYGLILSVHKRRKMEI